ncbi:putative bifunctional diguanylate cyclase/phosphodiesterase [Novosphingobium beihaiensis]|uniref:EAL domain-containing protein n=1 Tax=Novosphingobium beihaiensis TaxID=2930389 RepID=A0ABT0BM79_9SPHN|nr:EAL domain-containing protein [Novosphingobium beihaiensis]MCJ2186161.1 EAL domain-containing protein [Novosphingobium beihaiensis]
MSAEQAKHLERMERRVERERKARKSAEDLLEKKSLELFAANQELSALNATLEARVLRRTTELEAERERAVELAEKDYLTQLANRLLFSRKIDVAVEACRRGEEVCTLILVDLDDFKVINDTFGHMAGDTVLKTIAQRLQAHVEAPGLAARLGGDEFAVLLRGEQDSTAIERLARQLVEAAQAPIPFGDQQLFSGASAGIASCPRDASTAKELFTFADFALYEAKARGRGHAVSFETRMASDYKRRRELGGDLEAVLQENGTDVFFQPIVDLETRAVCGAEALLRWCHPRLGWINPIDILSVAKDRNLLSHLTCQIIRTSLKKAGPLLRSGELAWVSINLADHDLRDKQLAGFILACCNEAGIRPDQLKLELTEHTLVVDMSVTRRVMKRLNDWGVQFAVDDFGTGYSNLLTLNRLPFHTLKIDQTFVADLFESDESQTIVKAMIDLAHSLKLDVIAEGVETIQQSEVLRALGCDFGQGYLFGRPDSLIQPPGQSSFEAGGGAGKRSASGGQL